MKRLPAALILAAGSLWLSAAEMVWNNAEAFKKWQAKANVKMTIEGNTVKLTDIA